MHLKSSIITNSKWSQYHKKKQTYNQTNKQKTTERYISRKDKLRLLFLHVFHTSFTFRHKHRFTKSKMKNKEKSHTGGTVPKSNKKIIETDKIILYTSTYLTWLWDITCFDTDRSASYFDLHLEIDGEGRLSTNLYDKRDDFDFPIVNFPLICSNIPAAPAYGVYIS